MYSSVCWLPYFPYFILIPFNIVIINLFNEIKVLVVSLGYFFRWLFQATSIYY